MRLFQKVGAVLPGRRKTAPAAVEAQAPGPVESPAPLPAGLPEPSLPPPAPAPAPAAPPEPDLPEVDLMALLPPELRQTLTSEALEAPEPAEAAPDPDEAPPLARDVVAEERPSEGPLAEGGLSEGRVQPPSGADLAALASTAAMEDDAPAASSQDFPASADGEPEAAATTLSPKPSASSQAPIPATASETFPAKDQLVPAPREDSGASAREEAPVAFGDPFSPKLTEGPPARGDAPAPLAAKADPDLPEAAGTWLEEDRRAILPDDWLDESPFNFDAPPVEALRSNFPAEGARALEVPARAITSASNLSAFLADGFRQIDDRRPAPLFEPGATPVELPTAPRPPRLAPAPAGSLSAFLEDGLRHLDVPRPLAAESAPSRPLPQRAAEPAVASLSAFLGDGLRHLDASGPEPRPIPAKPSRARAEPTRPPKGTASSQPSLAGAAEIAGLIGACLVDSESGLVLASEGRRLDHEAVAAVSTQVVRAEREVIALLGLEDQIEDILIIMGRQLHVIRPLERMPAVFLYLALDRKAANLGMARMQLARIEGSLAL